VNRPCEERDAGYTVVVSPRMYNTVFALLGLTLMAWLGAVGNHF
jgi:hypothetical protein